MNEVVQTLLVPFVDLPERWLNQGGNMFTRLIESRSHFVRTDMTTAASVAIHLTLITVAAYFTTARAIQNQDSEPLEPLVWIKTLPLTHHATTSSAPRPSSVSTARSVAAPTQLSLAINANIPDVNIQLVDVRANDEFTEGVTGSSSGPPAALSSDPSQPFDAREVDYPVTALSNQPTPAYPPALRSAGIEGRVIAQFVVDSKGDPVRESIRIVSSTNDLFSESVTKAIREMRFAPARIGSNAVAQVVQQLFVFRLDR